MSFSSMKEVELGKCVELIIDNRGKTPKKMGGDWVDKGIRTISAKNIHGGKLTNIDDIRFVSKGVYEKWMKIDIKKGDCLLVSEGATLGENLYWDNNEKIVLGQRLFGIRTNNDILDSKYFSAYMNTRKYQKEIDGRSTGTSVLGLRQTELLKTKVLIRPIEEQRFIGELYYEINKKIEINNKINENLQSISQLLFKHWFIDFEFPNEEGLPYKSTGGEMVDSELGLIPKGWNVKRFDEIFNFMKGKKPNIIDAIKNDNFKEYLTIGVINQHEKLFASADKIIEVNNEVMMVMDGASSGDVYQGYNGILGSTLSKLCIQYDGISNEFLYSCIKTFEADIKKHLTGSAIPHTDKEYVKRINIVLPIDKRKLVDLQQNFINLKNKINTNIIENEKLKNLRGILLPKLMNGGIDLSNIELNQ